MTAILPAMLPSRAVAAIFASRGGEATPDAKRSSAQANGRKGGRAAKDIKDQGRVSWPESALLFLIARLS